MKTKERIERRMIWLLYHLFNYSFRNLDTMDTEINYKIFSLKAPVNKLKSILLF